MLRLMSRTPTISPSVALCLLSWPIGPAFKVGEVKVSLMCQSVVSVASTAHAYATGGRVEVIKALIMEGNLPFCLSHIFSLIV